MMRVEHRDDGALVSGYLDTGSVSRADAFDTVLVRGNRPYQAEMRRHRFGVLSACDISGEEPVGVLPRASPAARSDGHLLGLLLTGHATLEQDGRLASLTAGEFALYRGGVPFRLELTGPYRYLVMNLDQGVASLLRQAGDAMANPQLSRFASGRILVAALVELVGLAEQMGPLTRQEMGEHITCMLRTLIHEAHRRGPDPDDGRAAVFARVLEHIDVHLGGELSPESISAAAHISVRYLHALFQRHGGTVGQHIRRRRLDRIRRDLADPGLAHLPAYAVAMRWGLENPSHFSKLFRSEFGLSPWEFRQQMRNVSPEGS
jgi:AraC-like DNA-binding protein